MKKKWYTFQNPRHVGYKEIEKKNEEVSTSFRKNKNSSVCCGREEEEKDSLDRVTVIDSNRGVQTFLILTNLAHYKCL